MEKVYIVFGVWNHDFTDMDDYYGITFHERETLGVFSTKEKAMNKVNEVVNTEGCSYDEVYYDDYEK